MISLDQWRAAIGRWARGARSTGDFGASVIAVALLNYILCAATVAALLIIGGVEANPGPDYYSDEVVEELRAMRRHIAYPGKDEHSVLMREIMGYRQRLEDLERRVDGLSRENNFLSRRVDYFENQSRRNNLLIFGLDEQQNERWEESEGLVRDVAAQVGVDLAPFDVERAHRIGRRTGKRPIVVKLASYKKKEEMLSSASRYLRNAPIRVAEDFSAPVRQTRKQLGVYLQRARAKGHRASIRFDRLVVDGRKYTLREVEEVAAEENGADHPAAVATPPATPPPSSRGVSSPAATPPPPTRRVSPPAAKAPPPPPASHPPSGRVSQPAAEAPSPPTIPAATPPQLRGLSPAQPARARSPQRASAADPRLPLAPPPLPPRPAPTDRRAPSPVGRVTRGNPDGQWIPAKTGGRRRGQEKKTSLS